MLVSSVGYFNKGNISVLNNVESNKKHPVVNEGLKDLNLVSEHQDSLAEIFDSFKLIFTYKNSDCAKSLNMIA